MRANEKGPHQISNVEKDSPASYAGLRNDDLILKVNDINVVGERYNKTVALIKNESEKGRLKLEVIDTQSCSNEIRNIVLTPQSGYSTLNKPIKSSSSKSGSIDNLRNITAEIIASGSGRDTVRSVSQLPTQRDTDSTNTRKPRPASTSDIDRVPQINDTVRSNASYGSEATFTSEIRPSNFDSTRSLSSNIGGTGYKPKFKRCNVQILPDFKGYGFAINSKIKPKFMIYTVDPQSPAYKANLRESDVIVQIDNKNIRKMSFDKVKKLLSDSQKKGQVEILAIDNEGYKYYKERKKRFSNKKLVTAENTEIFNIPTSALITEQQPLSDTEDNNSREPGIRSGQQDTASSSKIQITVPSVAPITSEQQPTTSGSTDTILDNFDIIACVVNREADKPLGLSLSTAVNRSQSRASSASSSNNRKQQIENDDVILPIITSVDDGSAAAKSGLRANDLILEINGKSTTGQTNNTVGKWIRASGDQIEFIVSREKVATIVSNDPDIILKENAKKIAEEALQAAKNRMNTTTGGSPTQQQRLSRKDSAALSNRSNQESPKVVHSEIRMSSSRLQQDFPKQETPQITSTNIESSPKISTTRPRNQSEPAIQKEEIIISPATDESQQHKTGPSSTPLSKRSASSFHLPRDAPIPRLCRVRAYEEQLGFIVAGSRSNRGVFRVNEVTPNSPAAHSGLQNDDYIIEISGVNVESMTYNEVVDYIKERKQEDDLQLLVADRATLQWYKAKKIPISSQIVPKMQYIETLLKEELLADLNEQQSSSESKLLN
jgi:C-terminal processing protease CtpA/Prc